MSLKGFGYDELHTDDDDDDEDIDRRQKASSQYQIILSGDEVKCVVIIIILSGVGGLATGVDYGERKTTTDRKSVV